MGRGGWWVAQKFGSAEDARGAPVRCLAMPCPAAPHGGALRASSADPNFWAIKEAPYASTSSQNPTAWQRRRQKRQARPRGSRPRPRPRPAPPRLLPENLRLGFESKALMAPAAAIVAGGPCSLPVGLFHPVSARTPWRRPLPSPTHRPIGALSPGAACARSRGRRGRHVSRSLSLLVVPGSTWRSIRPSRARVRTAQQHGTAQHYTAIRCSARSGGYGV